MPLPDRQTVSDAVASTSEAMAALIRDAELETSAEGAALPIAPNPAFFLVHWPGEWSVEALGLEEPTWLPLLSKHIILPGCNLNRTLRLGEKPEAAYDQAVLANTRKGATYLLPEVHRLEDGRKYLQQAPCVDPRSGRAGTYYLEAWQTPLETIRGRRLKFRYDREGANRYRLWLVQAGIIRPAAPSVLLDRFRRVKRKADRIRAHTKLEKSEYTRRVKAADAEVERINGAAIPQPVPDVIAGRAA